MLSGRCGAKKKMCEEKDRLPTGRGFGHTGASAAPQRLPFWPQRRLRRQLLAASQLGFGALESPQRNVSCLPLLQLLQGQRGGGGQGGPECRDNISRPMPWAAEQSGRWRRSALAMFQRYIEI